jgi:hypothetical protein
MVIFLMLSDLQHRFGDLDPSQRILAIEKGGACGISEFTHKVSIITYYSNLVNLSCCYHDREQLSY